LNEPPFHAGDFVWCAFPEREHPARPGRHSHIVYTILVTGSVSSGTAAVAEPSGQTYQAVVAYSTSQPWQEEGHRPGIIAFNAEQAAGLGQQRPFWLHLWRLAHLPITQAWFPRLSAPEGAIVGSAYSALRRQLEAKTAEIFSRHGNETVQLGPLASRPRR
jgi:hypothetical protein